MSNHAPVPWTIATLLTDDGEGEEITICDSNGDAVAIIARVEHYSEEAQANAHLLVKAPQMYAELERICHEISRFDHECAQNQHTNTSHAWMLFYEMRNRAASLLDQIDDPNEILEHP